MEKFIYLFIKNWLDAYNVGYNHYELYNGQPLDLTITNLYPAVYLEILPLEWKSLPGQIQEAEAIFRLHLVNEMYSSLDSDDKDINKSLDILDFTRDVYRALDMKSSDDDRIPQLIEHQEYYNINTMNRFRTIQNTKIKSRYITMIDYSAQIREYSNWKYNNYIDFNATTITGTTTSNTGVSFDIGGDF
jgi:hypothetical protein